MSDMSVRRLRQCALPDPNDERDVWCAKELTWAADRIEELEAQLSDWSMTPRGAQEIIERQARDIAEQEVFEASWKKELHVKQKRIEALEAENAILEQVVDKLQKTIDDFKNAYRTKDKAP